jgi:hypothetical protein
MKEVGLEEEMDLDDEGRVGASVAPLSVCGGTMAEGIVVEVSATEKDARTP